MIHQSLIETCTQLHGIVATEWPGQWKISKVGERGVASSQSPESELVSMGLSTGARVAPSTGQQTWSDTVATSGVLEIPVLGNTV